MAEQTSNLKETWLSKQPLLVEAAVSTAASGALGAAVGASIGMLAGVPSIASLKHAQFFLQLYAGGPLVQARNFAVLIGADVGISCVMRRFRSGREDVKSRMVVGFGSATLYSLVRRMGGPHQAANDPFFALFQAFIFALLFALVRVGTFQQKSSQAPVEDEYYAKTRSMLSNLGLRNYEDNFKRGLLTDTTLPLLTESALRDVKIPPGPRLLILDHIERNRELKDRRTA